MNRFYLRRLALSSIFLPLLLSTSLSARAAQCEYVISNEWNSGFTANVKITNDTQQTIQGWSVELKYSDATSITNMWNADVSGSDPYVATNKNYNGNISAGGSVQFGFNGKKGQANSPAMSPALSGICAQSAGNGAPTAIIQASQQSGVAPLTVQFTGAASHDAEGDNLDYLWQFGEGQTSTLINPVHVFEEPGEYSVSLVVNDGTTESQPSTMSIVVTEAPPQTARCEFSIKQEWQSGYTGNVTIFNDAASAIDGWQVVLSYSDGTSISGAWNSSVSGSNPFTFSNANYNAKINPGQNTTFGFNAQKGQSGQPVVPPQLSGMCNGTTTPNQPPTAQISASTLSGTVPFDVTFSGAESTDPDGDDISYIWSITSGDTEVVSNSESAFSYTFTQAGEYQVNLSVSDGESTSNTESVIVSAIEPQKGQAYQLIAERSSIHFVSTKKLHIIETHTFTGLSGSITEDGQASLNINLDSIESGIDIRNGRMREHLFETATFAESNISADVDMDALAAMEIGGIANHSLAADIDLHGVVAIINTQVRVSKLTENVYMVQNTAPIVLNAEDFALTSGIETLRNLAGLDVISYAVPANFTLVFEAQQQGGAQ